MKQLFLISICILPLHFCIGQSNVGIDIDSDLSVNNLRTYSIGSFDTRDASYKGTPLLWDDWMSASILLEGNSKYSTKQYVCNYDTFTKSLYVKVGVNIYTLNIEKLDRMLVSTFINEETLFRVIKDEKGDAEFYEVVYQDDKYQLLANTSSKLGKAYYNTALDAGDLNPSIIKRQSLYIYSSGKLFQLPKKRKQMVAKFGNNDEIKDVVDYFKKKKIELQDEDEVQSALIELNKRK